jgi:hypothetical protein
VTLTASNDSVTPQKTATLETVITPTLSVRFLRRRRCFATAHYSIETVVRNRLPRSWRLIFTKGTRSTVFHRIGPFRGSRLPRVEPDAIEAIGGLSVASLVGRLSWRPLAVPAPAAELVALTVAQSQSVLRSWLRIPTRPPNLPPFPAPFQDAYSGRALLLNLGTGIAFQFDHLPWPRAKQKSLMKHRCRLSTE